ncbi:type III restriction enzyme [Plectosphaerella cucumerina]|jgi:ATP-dependent DNA helicase MPH1|uniref:ATP-dependent DNA helicase n=1 Tax=Plectosphaerella cucumerina TaxID=40658 RepID=A0A8K0TBY5_9PEZI|nr:type III restriction enzyme [Plectosphaerella cucumerina]
MDSDEYDDIADEDLAEALTQSENFGGSFTGAPGKTASSKANGNSTAAQLGLSEFDDLPTDAFSSSPEPGYGAAAATRAPQQDVSRRQPGVFRQTTLFGERLESADTDRPLAPNLGRVYRGDKPDVPTQHILDLDALKTWLYPKNLGAIRDYQYSIVKNGLFNNTLVALPTGLGKTFIAATIMLNYYRWTKTSKIVFVAPTKPLVAQQVDACFNIVGIARSDTTMLTGECAPALRADEWKTKRVFFMTPQTLLNDISRGYADPKSIVLLVIDEAHRATGEYAYAKVTKQIRRFNPYFRILALTATPGSKVETVQEVMDNLGISHTEIRTEDSMDIRQYVHTRNIDQRLLDPSDEMCEIKRLFTLALKPLMDKLTQQNVYYGRDPMAITTYGLMKQQKEWFQSTAKSKPEGVQNMMRAIFVILMSLAHSIKLLNFHGIKPFYDNLKEFRTEVESKKGDKGSKFKKQIVADASFQEMMDRIESWMRIPDFVGHPKLTELANTILNHFIDAEQRGETTRAIVFSEYRDSAEEIVRALNIHRPMIKATVFVGQADSKRSAGMKQSEQIQTVERFKEGHYNVLVATSIGEEGLDIGQVDLIVCYDASSSPIRMLQRMGRTGRKREGNVVLLLMNGKEADNFASARDNYESMQKLICEGSQFNFRHDLSPRIFPREIKPEVDIRFIDIPVENTQDNALPEPRKRKAAAAKTKKLPPKKFHMPDGVETGFMKASDLGKAPSAAKRGRPTATAPPQPSEMDELAEMPPWEHVLLNNRQTAELNRVYRSLPATEPQEAEYPSLAAHPLSQRVLRPVGRVKHGKRTKRFVGLMSRLAKDCYRNPGNAWTYPYGETDSSRWKELPGPEFASDTAQGGVDLPSAVEISDDETPVAPQPKRRKTAKAPRKSAARTPAANDAAASEDDEPTPRPRGRKPKAAPKPRKRKAATKKGPAINSDELGDDCERSSDVLDTDGSDSGGDLVDFLVSDDHPISSLPASSNLPPSSQTSSPGPARRKGAPFFVPTQFTATQESMDELPDIDALTADKGARRPSRLTVVDESSGDEVDEDEDVVPTKQKGRLQRRRAVVEESDDGEGTDYS